MNDGNPLFNMFGGGNNMMNNIPGPLGNINNMVNQFNRFLQTFQGTPQIAQQQVQQMMNSGQMNQNQFNQMVPVAQAIMRAIGLK